MPLVKCTYAYLEDIRSHDNDFVTAGNLPVSLTPHYFDDKNPGPEHSRVDSVRGDK
jgi:hypothetical protein